MFNFPSSPAVGDQYASPGGPVYQWNGVAWGTSAVWPGGGINEYIYPANATWVKPPNLKFLDVEALGAGGGGGPGAATAAGQYTAGSGGGAGGRGMGLYAAAELPASVPITIGAAGASGAAGGTTSFGSLGDAIGGQPGVTSAVATTVAVPAVGGYGGSRSGFKHGAAGAHGGPGLALAISNGYSLRGGGGASPYRAGGRSYYAYTSNFGDPANGWGGGGSGGHTNISSALQAGGAGTAGFVRVREYTSDWEPAVLDLLKPTADTRNRIVNPAMQISQELGVGTGTGTNGAYACDQWNLQFLTSGAPTAAVIADVDGLNVLRLYAGATADTSIAAGDHVHTRQPIEGINITDFKWGTASGKPAVLRFSGRANVASLVIGVSIRNDNGSRSFVRNVTLTGTMQDFVISIPPCLDGTWLTGNVAGMLVSFAGTSGSNTIGAAENTWLTTNAIAAAGVGNLMSTINQAIYIRDVGLYLDPNNTKLPPPWQMPDEAQELRACQRYWQKSYAFYVGNVVSTVSYATVHNAPVLPRPGGAALSGVDGGIASNFPATMSYVLQGTGQHAIENRVCSATSTFGRYSSILTWNARL